MESPRENFEDFIALLSTSAGATTFTKRLYFQPFNGSLGQGSMELIQFARLHFRYFVKPISVGILDSLRFISTASGISNEPCCNTSSNELLGSTPSSRIFEWLVL
jgi:hypothetical protein